MKKTVVILKSNNGTENVMNRVEPVQERGIEKRELLVRAGRDLFSVHNYDDVDVKMIAGRAGVSIGTFYRYFVDKADMFKEITRSNDRDIIMKFKERAEELEGNTDGLMSLLNDLTGELINSRHLSRTMYRQSVAMMYTSPEIELIFREKEKKSLRIIKKLLASNGISMEGKDADVTARMVHAVLRDSTRSYILFKSGIPRERFVYELSEMIVKYLEL